MDIDVNFYGESRSQLNKLTPLHNLCVLGIDKDIKFEMMKMLIDAGADWNIKTINYGEDRDFIELLTSGRGTGSRWQISDICFPISL